MSTGISEYRYDTIGPFQLIQIPFRLSLNLQRAKRALAPYLAGFQLESHPRANMGTFW